MILNFNNFFESYNYHSFVDLLNLCKEISDYIYNKNIIDSDHFENFKEVKNGYEIIFNKNGKKNYYIDSVKKTIKDDDGVDQSIDKVYEDIENLYNILLNDFLINIKQIDEKLIFKKIFESEFKTKFKNKIGEKYSSLKKGVLELLDNHLNNDLSKLENYIKDFTDPDKDEILEGFIEDADIMSFYLKYQSDIDQILLDNEYYNEPPNVESLYDYVINGTYDAVIYCMLELKKII